MERMTKMTNATLRRTSALALLLPLAFAAGCKNFFPPLNGGTGTGTGTGNTGDYAYVVSANTVSASDPIYSLNAFSIGTATLTRLSGFPVTLPFPPAMAVVNPANSLLYVAGAQVIYGYSIASSGALTEVLSSTLSPALANANIVSMAISPDGQWLLALDVADTAVTVDEFQILSTGLLNAEPVTQYVLTSGDPIVASQLAISPKGDYVAAAVGTGGAVLFSFATSTGALTPVYEAFPGSSSSADQAVTFDATDSVLYVARSGTNGGVVPYTIGTGGALTQVAGAPFSLGTNATGPSSILIDATGKYLYVGNKTSSNISGFSIASGGVLTALSGSPYTSGTNVGALARDNTGDYVLATAINGSPDLQMYSFDSTTPGKLDAATSATTGNPTEPAGAVAIALTH